MKNKCVFAVLVVIGLAVVATVAAFRQPRVVKAQEEILPPDLRFSFGSVGITSGQTLRVSVANTILPNDGNLPPGPTRVVMSFRFMNGNLVRDAKGEVVRKVVDLERGETAVLDLDYDRLPPSPIRAQIRPVLLVTPPPVSDPSQKATPPDGTVPTVEVINNANGRSQFALFTHPAELRGFVIDH